MYKFTAKFHANVQATHPTTLEVTCEERLTPRGDCVLLTSSTHDPEALVEECEEGSPAELVVVTPFGTFRVEGICAPRGVGCSFVLRKSFSEVPRTLMVGCNKASVDVPRRLVKEGRLWGVKALVLLRKLGSRGGASLRGPSPR